MTQIPYFTPTTPQDFRNRKGMLIAAGIVMIIIGGFSGCLASAMPFALIMQRSSGVVPTSRMEVSGVIAGIALYAAAAVGLIWTGIGSILARRWVRPIVLILSTIWLAIGIFGSIGVIIAMTNLPRIIAASRTGAAATMPVPSGAVVVGGVIAVVITIFVYVILPGAAILVYRPIDVQRTLEFYDPVQRWTDRCPLPVLGMSVACAVSAVFALMTIGYGVVSVYGFILTGVAALLVMLPLAAVFVWAAALIYRRKMFGWNLAVTILLLGQGSAIVSALFYDPDKLMNALGATTQQMDMVSSDPLARPVLMAIGGGILTIASMIFAIRIRHYFREQIADAPAGTTANTL